jgi:hypothetical protein
LQFSICVESGQNVCSKEGSSLAIDKGFKRSLYISGEATRGNVDGVVTYIQSGHSRSAEMRIQVGEEIQQAMATEIDHTKLCVREIINALNKQVSKGAEPHDVIHALSFLLCLYKTKFGMSTEQMLKLFEMYVSRLDAEITDEMSTDDHDWN